MTPPQSLFDKLWHAHEVIAETAATPALLYIDLHLLHEVTSPQGFAELRRRGWPVHQPQRCLATLDHAIPTLPPDSAGQRPFATPAARHQVQTLRENCLQFGIPLHDWDSPHHGIVHVIGPELGATRPGMTIVCGDSHTSTHGAFAALAFGIGTTEVGHVLASQCLLQRKPRSMRVRFDGRLPAGVSAKDLILHTIGQLGVDGGTGHVIEYSGPALADLDMAARMTICNMSIEAGARAGMMAADQTTIDYLRARLPNMTDASTEQWLGWRSDDDAAFDREHLIDASQMAPMITYGTDPGMVVAIDQPVPHPVSATQLRALNYMGISAGKPLLGHPVDTVFIGSCTNSRLADLEAAAEVLRGQRIAADLRMLVVPGSATIKRQAEAAGLHHIFQAAGAEWREPGCSMCIAMNGDRVAAGKTAISTSNRNFEGRQGAGARTLLASPATAAASALMGAVADPRQSPAAMAAATHSISLNTEVA
ncbi:MAG: 3-isopropylmalate dehydratase large subunit [Wenzhouxiangellaceae bacterium]